jgi:hypothetical protein
MKLIDRNGKWPEFPRHRVHSAAIARALAHVPSADRATLSQQQLRMDTAREHAVPYEHAMRAEGQTVSQARELANRFVHNSLVKAIGAQRAGDRKTAMVNLGNAIHTLQDSTSPAHEGFQQKGAVGDVEHAATEWRDPGAGSALDQATKKAWDYFTGAVPLPKDFFEPAPPAAPTDACQERAGGCNAPGPD